MVRPALLVVPILVFVGACGPKVSMKPLTFDEDLGNETQVPKDPLTIPEEQRAVAPVGKGLRTGTIPRDRLNAVLDAGPGQFLRQVEVTARLVGDRFVGWQLVELVDRSGPLVDVDVVPGDVLLAINGKPLSRPDQLQTIWDSLRTANAVQAQMWRGDAKFTLDFTIDPPVATVPGVPEAPAAPVPPTAAPAKPAPSTPSVPVMLPPAKSTK